MEHPARLKSINPKQNTTSEESTNTFIKQIQKFAESQEPKQRVQGLKVKEYNHTRMEKDLFEAAEKRIGTVWILKTARRLLADYVIDGLETTTSRSYIADV
jgi:hypothetical protein